MLLFPSLLSFSCSLPGQVGTYNPMANKAGIKEVTFKVDRVRYWIGVGAKPSDRVAWLLGQVCDSRHSCQGFWEKERPESGVSALRSTSPHLTDCE